MRVNRNLNRPGETRQVEHLNLSPELQKYNFIQKKIHRFWGGPKAKIPLIWITYEIEPDKLELNKEELLYFQVGGKKHYSKIKNFEMDARGNKIVVGIDLSQIKDVNETPQGFIQEKEFSIRYKLYWRDKDNSKHYIDQGELDLGIAPLNCIGCKLKKTKILARTEEGEKIAVEHNISKSQEKLCELVFVHPGDLKFSNPVNSKLVLRVEDNEGEIKDGFFLEGEFGKSSEYNLYNITKNKKSPVFITIDFENFGNPAAPKLLKVFVDKEDYNPTTGENEKETIVEKELVVHPDSAVTQLGMEIMHDDKNLLHNIRKKPSQSITIKEPVLWAIGTENKNIELLSLTLWNSANNPEPDGQVDITNFKLEFSLKDQKGNLLKDRQGEVTGFENWLKSYKEPATAFNIANGDSPFWMRLILPSERIPKAIPDEVTVYISIKCCYREIQKAKMVDSGDIDVNIEIKFTLKRYVEKWLALDFGTCAIAAAIFDPNLQTQDNLELLNLNEVHDNRLREKWGDEKVIIFDEKGTEFLSAMMYLDIENAGGDKKSNPVVSLTRDIVKFSPTADDKRDLEFLSKVLPNIKMLLGHDFVPLNYSKGTRAIKIGPETYEKIPVKIIVKAAYQQLFKNYIIPSIKKLYSSLEGQPFSLELLKTFGNIVITVPNTFNQTHQQILKELFLRDIDWNLIPEDYKSPEIKDRKTSLFFKDRIKFVSESDAVACYYLNRWSQIHSKEEESPPIQYLLIYDIGAGTVDISYQKVIQGEGSLKIKDLGKIGIIKAGNSLDTVLTQIIDIDSKLKGVRLNYDVFSCEEKNLASLVSLKNFIKDGIKVELSRVWNLKADNSTLSYNAELFRRVRAWDKKAFDGLIKLGLFKRNFLLNDFMDSVTVKLIENLRNIVDKAYLENSKLKVDRVIISGRMANFLPLQERLKAIFNQYTTIKNMESVITVPEGELKKAVVLGALARVTTYAYSDFKERDINAYYGLLWKEKAFGGKDFAFKKLLEPGEKSQHTLYGSPKKVHGLYEIKPDDIDMTFADKVSLVKSFTPSPDVSFSSLRSEMITKVLEIRKDALGIGNPSKVPVKLKYDDNLMLRLRVKNVETDPANINAYSLEQDITFEENSWPFNQMTQLSREQDNILEKIKSGEIEWKIESAPEVKIREESEEQKSVISSEEIKEEPEENIHEEEEDERLL